MATTRSPYILGRVLRNLKRHGISPSSIEDEEIYSELTTAQKHILDEVSPHHFDDDDYCITWSDIFKPWDLSGVDISIIDDDGQYVTTDLSTLTTLTSSDGTINSIYDPVIDGIWDKALEYKATSEFLDGDGRAEYLTLYEKEIIKHTDSDSRVDPERNIQRRRAW